MTLDRGYRVVQIPIDDIVEVRATLRHVGRGIGLGAAIGGAIGGGLVLSKMGSGDENGFYMAVGLMPIITGVGIGLGAAAAAQPATRVVYRRSTSG